MIAPQIKESKRPPRKDQNEVLSWYFVSVYQQTDVKANISIGLPIKGSVCVMSLPLIFTLRCFRG